MLAQRLVRTLCKHCKEKVELSPEAISRSGIEPFLESGQREVYQAVGCSECMETGYSGRTSIHELFPLDDEMHRVIMNGADATVLHAAARRQGMITLYEDGLRKVAAGRTSMEELLRVTQDQSETETLVDAPVVEISLEEVSA